MIHWYSYLGKLSFIPHVEEIRDQDGLGQLLEHQNDESLYK